MNRRRKRCRQAASNLLTSSLILLASTPRTCGLLSTALSCSQHAHHRPYVVRPLLAMLVASREMEVAVSSETQEREEMVVPPWLKRLDSYTNEDAMIHLDWLEYALLEEDFSFQDVKDIIRAVQSTAGGNVPLMVGIIDFCRLVLKVKEPADDAFISRDVLLASIIHFSDCITARGTGVYEMIKGAIYGRRKNHSGRNPRRLPYQFAPVDVIGNDDATSSSMSSNQMAMSLLSVAPCESAAATKESSHSDQVLRITRGAARVKRVEILAHTILKAGRLPSWKESSRLRGLLLSVMDDWRSLAIRAVACLYRMEGILHDCESGGVEYVELTQEIVKATREALHVYAPLAHRLGMHRLKAKLEDRAFRIMYRRQYRAVTTLYRVNGEEMHSISSNLSSHIDKVLRQNSVLMDQLEDLKVTSRVKEPFSLWKKLLKLRAQRLTPSSSSSSLVGTTESSSTSSELSLFDVKDGIAVRIILRASKWSQDEPDETTRGRERLLCYYVQQILRNYWPAVDQNHIKDYIQFPKPNGYQSLHYRSFINNQGKSWPFEVQVRSEEMHRIAEHGVAAHWDYKLGSRKIELLSPSLEERDAPSLPEGESSQANRHSADDASVLVSPVNDSYIDALVTARRDLVQQKVFVFFASSSAIGNVGQLLSLPVGAIVSDALVALNETLDLEIQIQDGSVLRNGRIAKADEYVGNGDVLLITL